jgi:small membrane protein
MIAQFLLSGLLGVAVIYAMASFRKTPLVSVVVAAAAGVGLYFVWLPDQANWLAEWVGIGRGVDLVLYIWVVVSLLAILNLHLLLRMQLEQITILARRIALSEAETRFAAHAGTSAAETAGPADAQR